MATDRQREFVGKHSLENLLAANRRALGIEFDSENNTGPFGYCRSIAFSGLV